MNIEVRSFKVNEKFFSLGIDTDTDDTSITDTNGNLIGLTFDSSGYVFYKEKQIGYIRHGFEGENRNLHFVYDGKIHDTGIAQHKVECYLDAEVVIMKWLFENKYISLD